MVTDEISVNNNCNSRTVVPRRKKTLTTCKVCGHFRFAKKFHGIQNETYPYRHSSKGGCPVDKMQYVQPGERYRKFCTCDYVLSRRNYSITKRP